MGVEDVGVNLKSTTTILEKMYVLKKILGPYPLSLNIKKESISWRFDWNFVGANETGSNTSLQRICPGL